MAINVPGLPFSSSERLKIETFDGISMARR